MQRLQVKKKHILPLLKSTVSIKFFFCSKFLQKLGKNLFQKKNVWMLSHIKQTNNKPYPTTTYCLGHYCGTYWMFKESFPPPTEVLNDIAIKNMGHFKVHVSHHEKNQRKKKEIYNILKLTCYLNLNYVLFVFVVCLYHGKIKRKYISFQVWKELLGSELSNNHEEWLLFPSKIALHFFLFIPCSESFGLLDHPSAQNLDI